ncbi:MAG TPA: hypothetical protein VFA59_05595 [Vicinamibacterales bacterium]|nr:hypothetical protein [Vicinamibacterales bacterium]
MISDRIATRVLAEFDVPDPIVGDLFEQRAKRSRLWFWAQSLAAIGVAIRRAIVCDARLAARVTLVGIVTLAAGVWLSWQMYWWATFAISFPHRVIVNPYFVLAWHAYCLPLNLLWCASGMLAGRSMMRADPRRRATLAVVGVVAATPILVWCGWGPVAALLRTTHPATPRLLRFQIGFAFDVLVVFLGMPACAISAALNSRQSTVDRRLKTATARGGR